MERYKITATGKDKENKVWTRDDYSRNEHNVLNACFIIADKSVVEIGFDSAEVLDTSTNIVIYKITKAELLAEEILRNCLRK